MTGQVSHQCRFLFDFTDKLIHRKESSQLERCLGKQVVWFMQCTVQVLMFAKMRHHVWAGENKASELLEKMVLAAGIPAFQQLLSDDLDLPSLSSAVVKE